MIRTSNIWGWLKKLKNLEFKIQNSESKIQSSQKREMGAVNGGESTGISVSQCIN